MKPEKCRLFKKIMIWTGIILTGLFGVVMFGGDKITSGILLIVTMILMILPIGQNKDLRWIRIGFVCIVFGFVIWNISTTDLPSDRLLSSSPENPIAQEGTYSTGFRFLDQLIHIFRGFLQGRIFHREPL